MKFGLSASEMTFLQDKLISPLKKYGANVYIFGSRATGKNQKFSDIDILYKETAGAIPSSIIYQLLMEIDESAFPYKIDLVNDNELAYSYRQSVEKQKVEL